MGRMYLNGGGAETRAKVPAPSEKIVEPVIEYLTVEKLVEVPVFVDRPVEVVVEKFVDRPVFVDRPIMVEKFIEVEKLVEVEKPIYYETVKTVEIYKAPKTFIVLAAVQAAIIIVLLAF